MSKNKNTLALASVFLVEHLKNNAPLIVDEIRRWRYLLRDDYIEHQHREEHEQRLLHPFRSYFL